MYVSGHASRTLGAALTIREALLPKWRAENEGTVDGPAVPGPSGPDRRSRQNKGDEWVEHGSRSLMLGVILLHRICLGLRHAEVPHVTHADAENDADDGLRKPGACLSTPDFRGYHVPLAR